MSQNNLMPKSRSALWGFFEKTFNENKKAMCQLCGAKLSYLTLDTLKEHLEELHTEEYKDVYEKTRQIDEDENTDTQVSRLWKYFIEDTYNKVVAICNFCHQTILFQSTITNLKRHLKKRHLEAYKKYLKINNKVGPKDVDEIEKLELKAKKKIYITPSAPPTHNDESNFSRKFVKEVWGKFETHDAIARCTLCKSVVENTIEDMKLHLEDAHPSVLAQIIRNDSDSTDSESIQNNESDVSSESEYCEDKTSKKKTHSFWRYYKIKSKLERKAQCMLCGKELSYLSTGNLRKHLQRQHKEENTILINTPKKTETKRKLSLNLSATSKNTVGIWKFFECVDKNNKLAKCKACKNIFSYKASIGNLNKHSKRKHPEIYNEYYTGTLNSPPVTPMNKSVDAKRIKLSSRSRVTKQDDDLDSSGVQKSSKAFKKPKESHIEDTSVSYSEDVPNEDTNDSIGSDPQNNDEDMVEYDYLEDKKNASPFELKADPISDPNIHVKIEKSTLDSNNEKLRNAKQNRLLWSFFKTNGADRTVHCNLCKNVFSCFTSTTNLNKHLISKHNHVYAARVLAYRAKHPNLSFTSENIGYANLWKYFESENDEKILKCIICRKVLTCRITVANLIKHLEEKHEGVYKEYPLESKLDDTSKASPVCKLETEIAQNDETHSIKKLRRKLLKQFDVQEYVASCNICKTTTEKTLEDMKSHLEEVHHSTLTNIMENDENEDNDLSGCDNEQYEGLETEYFEDNANTLGNSEETSDQTQEISTFLRYIGVLLNKVKGRSLGKLQVNIINMIMKETDM